MGKIVLRFLLISLLLALTIPAWGQDDDEFFDDFDFSDEEEFFDPDTGTFDEWLDSDDATDWDADGDVDDDDYELLLWLFDDDTDDRDGDGFFDEEDFFLSQWLDGPDAADLNDDGEIDDIDYILSLEAEGFFENEIEYVFVEPGFEHVIIEWETIEPGAIDSVFLRVEGDLEWDVYLVEAEEDAESDELFNHLLVIDGLEGNTEYEMELRSVSLDGFNSELYEDEFRTRSSPDLRPAVIVDLDYETEEEEFEVYWETNRLTDARYELIRSSDGAVVARDTLDREGQFVHEVELEGLTPGAAYEITVESAPVRLSGLAAGTDLSDRRTVVLTAPTGSAPIRLLYPPYEVVGPNSVLIEAEFSKSVRLRVDFARVDNFRSSTGAATKLYKDSLLSAVARVHLINIPRLKPSTAYRYRIVAVASNGDSFSTDPYGSDQWSYDWQFVTSGPGDTLAPVIIEGPEIIARDRIAILQWVTDVETTGRVSFGTLGTTFGTADEFSVSDLAADGSPVLSDEHVVTLAGLEPGTTYQFRIESTAANGRTVLFTPGTTAGKRAGLRQPPGGAGSFTTDNMPDTQVPVILSGPTVTSRTHESAVVEWVTDEPADSQIRFGVDNLVEAVRSGASGTAHKLVLSNLQANTRYRYTVASTDAIGNGPVQSVEGVLTTNGDADLAAPQLTALPTVTYKNDRTATLRWMTDEVSATRIHFGPDPRLDRQRELSQTGTEHVVALTNLEPATRYYFRVDASDLSNNGPTQSAIDSFVTDANPDLASPLLTDLSANPADALAIIRWQTDELSDSFVEYGPDSLLLGTRVGDGSDVGQHEIALTNLTPATRYYYKAGSVDPAHNPVTESATQSFVTLAAADTVAPAPPTNLRVVAGSQQVLLRWGASLSADVIGYDIARSEAGGAFQSLVTRVADTTYADQGLINGETYQYRVVAVDRATPPNLSVGDSVTTQPTASAAPTAPTPVRAQGSVLTPTLVFGNATPFATGAGLSYTVQVSTDLAFTTFVASVSGLGEGAGGTEGQTAWTVARQLTQNTTYYWRVRAEEGDLLGPFSAAGRFVTQTQSASTAGDFNGDQTVNLDDFFLFVDAFGRPAADVGAVFDLDRNGAVDLSDFFLFVDAFSTSASGKRWVTEQESDPTTRFVLSAHGDTPGGEAAVDLHAERVTDLRAFGLVLRYDAMRVRFVGLEPGELLETGGAAPLLHILSEEPGQIVLGNGLAQGDRVTGSGRLARLRFDVGADRSSVTFTPLAYVLRSDGVPRAVESFAAARLLPRAYQLGNNYPNPFNPSTQIDYAMPTEGPVRLQLFDVLGQRVRLLVDESAHRAGYHSVVWDGRDASGRNVGSGIYFYLLEAGSFRQMRRMVLIK